MRAIALVALLVVTACDGSTRRPGGNNPPPPNRDAAPSTDGAPGPDAGLDDGAIVDARPAADAAPPQDAEGLDGASPVDAGASDADGLDAEGLDAIGFDALGFDAQPMFPDAQPMFPDAQPMFPDAAAPDAQTATPDAGPPTGASLAIAAARALPNGPAGVVVDGALVTFVRTQALGNDLTGFAIQAAQAGPALWIAVDPATLSPPPAVGDRIRLTIDQVGSNTTTIRLASAVSGYARLQSGVSTASLVQDISTATDVVSNVNDYELELVRTQATIAAGFRAAGSFFQSARVETAGVIGDPSFEIRMPTAVNDALGLGFGCSFAVTNPLWRFEVRPQIQAFAPGEITNLSCPQARLVTAAAPYPGRVILAFDRALSVGSVAANGSQITFNGGLQATAARVVGTNLIVTTTGQISGFGYQATVAANVTDVRGNALDANFRSASFSGSPSVARVKINELNANIAQGCDLVELRAEVGGSMDGWTLRSRDIAMATFSGLVVAANQFVVVHATGANLTCNPGSISGGETGAPNSVPRSLQSTNFDTAFDWYSTQGGIVNTDTVLTLFDAAGNVVDAVLLSDDASGATANASEDAAHLVTGVGEWSTPAGTVPSGGFVDDNFSNHAVLDLNGTATDASGTTIQRGGNTDSNSATDWNVFNAATWGALNPGQSPF